MTGDPCFSITPAAKLEVSLSNCSFFRAPPRHLKQNRNPCGAEQAQDNYTKWCTLVDVCLRNLRDFSKIGDDSWRMFNRVRKRMETRCCKDLKTSDPSHTRPADRPADRPLQAVRTLPPSLQQILYGSFREKNEGKQSHMKICQK